MLQCPGALVAPGQLRLTISRSPTSRTYWPSAWMMLPCSSRATLLSLSPIRASSLARADPSTPDLDPFVQLLTELRGGRLPPPDCNSLRSPTACSRCSPKPDPVTPLRTICHPSVRVTAVVWPMSVITPISLRTSSPYLLAASSRRLERRIRCSLRGKSMPPMASMKSPQRLLSAATRAASRMQSHSITSSPKRRSSRHTLTAGPPIC
ncbi:hypothetical protein D3C86_1563080 [compost metagenome]